MKDIECPYCGHPQDINHDDGYGYHEDEVYNQDCCECGKTFIYTTGIIFNYYPEKADCLNGGNHTWEYTKTYPKECTQMQCTSCHDYRPMTKDERKKLFEE